MCEKCEEAFEEYKKIRVVAYERADKIRNEAFEKYKEIRAHCKDGEKRWDSEKYGRRN